MRKRIIGTAHPTLVGLLVKASDSPTAEETVYPWEQVVRRSNLFWYPLDNGNEPLTENGCELVLRIKGDRANKAAHLAQERCFRRNWLAGTVTFTCHCKQRPGRLFCRIILLAMASIIPCLVMLLISPFMHSFSHVALESRPFVFIALTTTLLILGYDFVYGLMICYGLATHKPIKRLFIDNAGITIEREDGSIITCQWQEVRKIEFVLLRLHDGRTISLGDLPGCAKTMLRIVAERICVDGRTKTRHSWKLESLRSMTPTVLALTTLMGILSYLTTPSASGWKTAFLSLMLFITAMLNLAYITYKQQIHKWFKRHFRNQRTRRQRSIELQE